MRFTRLIIAFPGDIGSIGAVLNLYSGFWTQLSCGEPAFVEDQALHVVGQIGQHDLGLRPPDADGADEQPHMCLLLRKDVFDSCPYLRLGAVGCTKRLRPRLALWLLAMDPAHPAMGCKPGFIGL